MEKEMLQDTLGERFEVVHARSYPTKSATILECCVCECGRCANAAMFVKSVVKGSSAYRDMGVFVKRWFAQNDPGV